MGFLGPDLVNLRRGGSGDQLSTRHRASPS
jgi:hypothetical protein